MAPYNKPMDVQNLPQYSSSPQVRSRKLWVILVGIVLLITLVSGSLFMFNRSDEKKEPLPVIPKEAVFSSEEILVQFTPEYAPAKTGVNKKWDTLYSQLQKLGVLSYEKVFDSSDPLLVLHYKLKLKKGTDIIKVREEIYQLEGIKAAEPDYMMTTQSVPNDQYYPQMWDMKKIDMEKAWDITTGSNNVTVAVVDTGIDYNHPDFGGRTIIKGPDFSTCDSTAKEAQAARGCTRPKAPDNDPMDNMGHGTHVAGTIGAVANNGGGIAGINWNVKLMAVKVMGAGGIASDVTDITKGIQYAIDHGANVINMSLGGQGTCSSGSAYQAVIDYARSKGVTVVVAAGNDNTDATQFVPAACTGVIVVGATGPNDQRASYSNFGNKVDIAAPGGQPVGGSCSASTCILSTWPNGQLNAIPGTSMASPHVAGVAALILAQNPNYSPDDVKRCLINSADPITTDRPIGGRRLNAFNAVNSCSAANPNPTVPVSSITPSDMPGTTPATGGTFVVSGTVYHDDNKNLSKDSAESPYSGIDLNLSGPVSPTKVTTGNSGGYQFGNLTAGAYVLQASLQGSVIMEYRFTVDSSHANWVIDIPIPPQLNTSSPSPTGTGSNGGNNGGGTDQPGSSTTKVSGTPSPTPRMIYSCKERKTTRVVNNKSVQLKYLECTPKGYSK